MANLQQNRQTGQRGTTSPLAPMRFEEASSRSHLLASSPSKP
ncbi:hypothetical protein RESH_02031 [Rhodopirellula europaea SH398]|uniref:Uncharacterized protein n=1 Tax=Rhodopirellula europaea SH398 TaxID=1263868 RepID=M5SI64_9BACT|nr:hypothetical protein RESH_02031 [Rhodopirellula europaea SH398]